MVSVVVFWIKLNYLCNFTDNWFRMKLNYVGNDFDAGGDCLQICGHIKTFGYVRTFYDTHDAAQNYSLHKVPKFHLISCCGNFVFLAICPKLCGNCAFSQNFHTRHQVKLRYFMLAVISNIPGLVMIFVLIMIWVFD